EMPDYDFKKTNNEIEKLNLEVLSIRSAINKANQGTKIGIKDYSISDALIRIAQLSSQSDRLEMLGSYRQKSRQTTYNGVVEYTEYVYDVKQAQDLHFETVNEIHKLQTAVDKANILTEIEI
ncbi:MAG TPA: hypothetical protein VFC75_01260, partial [Erysipelothrix sp.]|nr:hypothetical protein [Erysipelothrix sp.]